METSLAHRLENLTSRLEQVASATSRSGATEPDKVPPSVEEFDHFISNRLPLFVAMSHDIGGEVRKLGDLVGDAFRHQRDFLMVAASSQKPTDEQLVALLKPTATIIAEIQELREKFHKSKFINHLATVAESISALGWVTVSPAPGPYVKEMSNAGQFFSNRVLKDFKASGDLHDSWVKSWTAILTDLQGYIKAYHTTGLQWNPKGKPAEEMLKKRAGETTKTSGAPPPPGPPPPMEVMNESKPSGTDQQKSALFADINKGSAITHSLKKVTDDMKTHKNPGLKFSAPQPFKPTSPRGLSAVKPVKPSKPVALKGTSTKPPKCLLEGKKWNVEHHEGNKNLVVTVTDMKQSVYTYCCNQCTIQVKGKVNAISMDNCKKTGLVFDEVIASVDFVNCQSVQAQMLAKAPLISIDKTDGCMIYLSKQSLDSQIVTAKSSEINVLVPDAAGEFREFPIPEQLHSVWDGTKMATSVKEINM